MGLYQPTIITPSSLNGTGVIDATQDMTVTFQINGTIPIYGWQFVIMKNDADSTVLYTSDWRYDYIVVEGQQIPVYTYGRDENGDLVPKSDTITAADLASAGVVNNYTNGYKLRVNQRYQVYENPNESSTVTPMVLEQISPVYFLAMEQATFDTSRWSNYSYGRYAWFEISVNHTSTNIFHISFDPLVEVRYRFAKGEDPDDNIISDTGNMIYGEGRNRVYGILDNNTSYAVRLTGKLESGSELDTGWYTFTTSWTDTALDYVHLKAYYVRNQPCTFVRLEVDDGYDESVITDLPDYQRWTIYRVRVSDGEKEKVGIIPVGHTGIYDFGIKNNTEYYYRAYYGLGNSDGYCYESNTVKMRQYWNWQIIECEKEEGNGYFIATHPYKNVMYHVKKVYQFQGNVESGAISNENEPYVENNFTGYPTVQKHSRIGLAGTLKGWVGKVSSAAFSDSIREINNVVNLSRSESVKFLRDRKGNLRMIEVGKAITKTTQDPYAEQPVEVEIPWVEVGDATGVQIVSTIDDGVLAMGDDIAYTVTSFQNTERSVLDISGVPQHTAYINPAYKWGNESSRTKSKIVELPIGTTEITVTANSSYPSVVAFLTTDSYTVGTNAALVEGTTLIDIAAGAEKTAEVPAGALYLYVLTSYVGSEYTPESIMVRQATGYIEWSYDETGYVGSTIDMDENGNLVQTYDNSMVYVPADLTINDEGYLEAETVIEVIQ